MLSQLGLIYWTMLVNLGFWYMLRKIQYAYSDQQSCASIWAIFYAFFIVTTFFYHYQLFHLRLTDYHMHNFKWLWGLSYWIICLWFAFHCGLCVLLIILQVSGSPTDHILKWVIWSKNTQLVCLTLNMMFFFVVAYYYYAEFHTDKELVTDKYGQLSSAVWSVLVSRYPRALVLMKIFHLSPTRQDMKRLFHIDNLLASVNTLHKTHLYQSYSLDHRFQDIVKSARAWVANAYLLYDMELQPDDPLLQDTGVEDDAVQQKADPNTFSQLDDFYGV